MKKRRKYIAWIFLIPSLIIYLYFMVYPAINGFKISLYDWSGFTKDMKFVGLKNFTRLLNDSIFLGSLKNTFVIFIIGVIGLCLLAFLFSILLNSGIKGKKVYRNIIFFPYIISSIVHGIFWSQFMFVPVKGMLNKFFGLLGIKSLEKFMFLSNDNIMGSMLFLIIWINLGFYLVVLLAGIDRIPKYLYEAAKIEGANEFQVFYKITLPLLKEVLVILLIFWGINAIKMFDIILAIGGNWPSNNIMTSAVYLYTVGFGKLVPVFKLGYASAIGVVTLFLVMIFAFVVGKFANKENYEY